MAWLRKIEPLAPNHKFLGLDGLRGLCAIAVVFRHIEDLTGSIWLPSANIAVDLFFIMSGFVIVQAYEHRLAGGMSATQFMIVRLIRLYPLYLFGTLIAVATALAALTAGVALDAWTPELLADATLPALLMLPMRVGNFEALYPINTPAWSLFFELIANAVFAVGLYRVSNRVLIWLVAVAASIVAVGAIVSGTLDGGAQWWNVSLGLSRVSFGFPMGMLIYRLYRQGSLRTLALPLPIVLFVAVAMMVFRPTNPEMVASWDLSCVLLISPAIIIACIGNETSRFGRLFGFLGFISYPVYMSHVFVYHSIRRLLMIAGGHDVVVPVPWGGIVVVAVSVLFAWGLGKYFDAPVRAWISARVQKRWSRAATNRA